MERQILLWLYHFHTHAWITSRFCVWTLLEHVYLLWQQDSWQPLPLFSDMQHTLSFTDYRTSFYINVFCLIWWFPGDGHLGCVHLGTVIKNTDLESQCILAISATTFGWPSLRSRMRSSILSWCLLRAKLGIKDPMRGLEPDKLLWIVHFFWGEGL